MIDTALGKAVPDATATADRQFRLECLQLASPLVGQTAMGGKSVVDIAAEFYAFVSGEAPKPAPVPTVTIDTRPDLPPVINRVSDGYVPDVHNAVLEAEV